MACRSSRPPAQRTGTFRFETHRAPAPTSTLVVTSVAKAVAGGILPPPGRVRSPPGSNHQAGRHDYFA